ncbi:MAG: sensor histidine kinase [Ramlibacter sp.]|nr:sensor histidine kinase [Ramlibacter sp.]
MPPPEAPAAAALPPAKPTLRAHLLRHVMLPLALTWAAGTVVALAVASYFTQQAFDRSLLDDAYLMASNVRFEGDGVALALTPHEVRTVLFDQTEAVFFSLHDADGHLIAGSDGLHAPPPVGASSYRFSYVSFKGRNLRAVTLRRDQPAPFTVVMAQTTLTRRGLLQRLLVYSVAPQVLLLLLLAAWLRRAIARDMQPLVALQQAVQQRDARDLMPLPMDASTSDIENLGNALNQLLGRLAQSVRAQREFAGNVAHELRTPLAGIRALAAYGLTRGEAEVWRQQLERIASSEARASRLVDQLLLLAFADEARTGVQLQDVALDEVVRDAVLAFLPSADALGVDLGAQGAEETVTVWGNRTLLEGCVNNLLDNALRYGKPSDPAVAPRVTVGIECEASGVRLVVSDNGPGLPAGMASQLLHRWTQGEQGHTLGQGAGLGLAIIAQYAGLLNARLDVSQGPPERGLSVSLTLARAAQGRPATNQTPPA